MSLVLRFIVGCVQIVAATGQTGLHDGEVLIWQGEVDDQFWLIVSEEGLQLLHLVGIHLSRPDVHRVAGLVDGLHQRVTFLLATAGNHELSKHVGILRNLERSHRSDATGANH